MPTTTKSACSVFASFQPDILAVDAFGGFSKMEYNTVLLMKTAEKIVKFLTEYALQWPLFRCHNMDLNLPGSEGCGDLKSDEACSDNDGAARFVRSFDNGTGIAKRAKNMYLGQLGTRDIEADCRMDEARLSVRSAVRLMRLIRCIFHSPAIPRLRIDGCNLSRVNGLAIGYSQSPYLRVALCETDTVVRLTAGKIYRVESTSSMFRRLNGQTKNAS